MSAALACRRTAQALSTIVFVALVLGQPGSVRAATPAVQMEQLTWPELRDRIAAGTTTVLLPIGGTEQNGPHMTLGKHNQRVRLLAERIAARLGNALVAPVLAYVPEGEIDPPTQHMRWPGTITVPVPVFEATLEAAARSLRKHGFCHVVLLGDHGGYRASVDRVAARLNHGKAAPGACGVHPLPEYYRASAADFVQALKDQGHGGAEIGIHAGLADTSLMLALDPTFVRGDKLSAASRGAGGDGVAGDPARATAELGRPGVEHIIDVAVAAIRAATRSAP